MAALEDIRASAAEGKLVIIAGAGVSMTMASKSTPAPSWIKLIQSGLLYSFEKGKIDSGQYQKWFDILKSDDVDDLLMCAEFVRKKLNSGGEILYARWLEQEFSNLKMNSSGMASAIKSAYNAGALICTLNYDKLLEKATKLSSINMKEPRKAMAWARREDTGILHLHGVWDIPETCILSISDYKDALADDFRSNIQRALSSFHRILFIGCGETIYDPNFSSLIKWVKEVIGSAGIQHYALVKSDEMDAKHRDALWQGFIEPVSFGSDFSELPDFIGKNIFGSSRSPARSRRARARASEDSIITSYRDFLIRDCGQMTIEGVRADADTAKQKFDIEKLFVPLKINSLPPEFPISDPKREQKLKKWQEENSEPLAFGSALAKHTRMALLALPGGGKTLLLKRLAVAYADTERRGITSDELPVLDILPILIRCREWRDHIRLPISSMIEQFGTITGQPGLNGLFEASGNRFKQGKILLLIDGLDEIHNDADRSIFVDNLEAFLELYPKIRLVVTSREAGFALIAPCLMRFCTRWKISPLESDAILLLCTYWHHLMGGSSQHTDEEIASVSSSLIENPALRRLAENPLLLTMLLVVKHGYGRLPPDRVSLYDRAVEVLLDTWNIKGHDALNPREAVPQLSYVAYRMMQSGKQTATERELLQIIEECRQRIPLVRLYASDSPSEFLKRVELRSSLLLEAGRLSENGRMVPFYQFRHLTFQEYLSAVAVVEGHYDAYKQGDSPLSPLNDVLLADEWREVIPMASVLAKKQANPILAELTRQGAAVEREFLVSRYKTADYQWSSSYRMPAPISRLTQCLVEEAEFAETVLLDTLRLVATFAHGCQSPENWSTLCKGPFGSPLFECAWEIYLKGALPRQAWMRNTVALIAGYRNRHSIGSIDFVFSEIIDHLGSGDEDKIGRAAALICGIMWLDGSELLTKSGRICQALEKCLFVTDSKVWELVAWSLAFVQSRAMDQSQAYYRIDDESLNFLVSKTLKMMDQDDYDISGFTLSTSLLFPRGDWTPNLSDTDVENIISIFRSDRKNNNHNRSFVEASMLLLYHARSIVSDDELLSFVSEGGLRFSSARMDHILKDLGVTDPHKLRLKARRQNSRSSPRKISSKKDR